MKVSIVEAKNRLSQLIRSALAGEEIVIANHGNPVVKLVPVDTNLERHGMRTTDKTLSTWLKENPLPNHLRRSHEDIEHGISTQRDSWE